MGWTLTVLGNHSERDDGASVLDELHDVVVRELNDGAPVYGWDAISYMQQAAAVGGTALDDAADFMRNHWKQAFRDMDTFSGCGHGKKLKVIFDFTADREKKKKNS